MSFFRKDTSLTDVPARKMTPQEIHDALTKLHQHKAAHNLQNVRRHRDLEELRNGALERTLNKISEHLENTDENYQCCRQAIIQLLAHNLQQTNNYARWFMNGKTAADISLGKIHRLCVNIMPDALVDVLVMIRARRLSKVVRITNEIDPETKEEIQSQTVTMGKRDLTLMDACLKDIDKPASKIVDTDQRIKTLRDEIEMEKYFSKLNISKCSHHLQQLLTEAKALHTNFMSDNLNPEQYAEFKQLVVNTALAIQGEGKDGQQLIKFITHMEKMQELIEHGVSLAAAQATHNGIVLNHHGP
jgi:hypothetical protein